MKLKLIYGIIYNELQYLQIKKAYKRKFMGNGILDTFNEISIIRQSFLTRETICFIQLENVCHFSKNADKIYNTVHRQLEVLPQMLILFKIRYETRTIRTSK